VIDAPCLVVLVEFARECRWLSSELERSHQRSTRMKMREQADVSVCRYATATTTSSSRNHDSVYDHIMMAIVSGASSSPSGTAMKSTVSAQLEIITMRILESWQIRSRCETKKPATRTHSKGSQSACRPSEAEEKPIVSHVA